MALSRRALQAPAWAAGLYALGLLAATWAPAGPPFQDALEWMWIAQAAEALRQGALAPDAGLAFAAVPVPNSLVQALLQLGAAAGAPLLALRLLCSALILGAVALAAAGARDAGPRLGPSVFAGIIAVALGAGMLSGFIAWVLGALGTAWLARRLHRGWRPGIGAVALIGVAAFFAHGIALACATLLIGAHALLGGLPMRRALGLIPAYILFGIYVAASLALVGIETGPRVIVPVMERSPLLETIGFRVYSLAKLGPYGNFAFQMATDIERAPPVYWVGVGLNLLWAGIAALAASALWLSLARRPETRASAAAIAAMMLLALAMPPMLGKLVNPGERFGGIGLMALLLCTGPGLARPAAAALQGLGAVSVLLPLKAGLLLLWTATAPPPTTEIMPSAPRDMRHLFRYVSDRFHARLLPELQAELEGGAPPIAWQTGPLRKTPDAQGG